MLTGPLGPESSSAFWKKSLRRHSANVSALQSHVPEHGTRREGLHLTLHCQACSLVHEFYYEPQLSSFWIKQVKVHFSRPLYPEDIFHLLEKSAPSFFPEDLCRDWMRRQLCRWEQWIIALRLLISFCFRNESKCYCWMWIRISELICVENYARWNGSYSLWETRIRHLLCVRQYPNSVRSFSLDKDRLLFWIDKCGAIWEPAIGRWVIENVIASGKE